MDLWQASPDFVLRQGHRKDLILTLPIVVFGVFRYLFLVHHRGQGEDPSRVLFRDRPLIASGLLYLLVLYVALSTEQLLLELR